MSPAAGVWPAVPRIGLTGGIACGKSLFLEELRKHGFRTLDADDIVHGLIPAGGEGPCIAAVPLLFEAGWEGDFDMIVCIVSPPETQIERMVATRALSRAEAQARIAAQMDTSEKAARAHIVVANDGTEAELACKAAEFAKRIYESYRKRI